MNIEVKNIGPISTLSIPVPDGGGIVVLRGAQGSGKSTALRAVSKMMGGSTRDLSARDNTHKGEVWFGSAKLTVGRSRITQKGELEVRNLEGRFDLSRLVDPQIQDPVAADAARLKALVALSGAKADPADFYAIAGGKQAFDELGVDTDTSDPVLLASRVGRAMHARARALEKQSQELYGQAKSLKESTLGADLEIDESVDDLHRAAEQARDKLRDLETQQELHQRQAAKVADARRQMEERKAKFAANSLSPEAVAEGLEQAKYSASVAEKRVAELSAQLKTAQELLERATHNLTNAERLAEVVAEHQREMESLGEIVSAATTDPVDSSALREARQNLEKAQARVIEGHKAKEARESLRRARLARDSAEEYARAASSLRDAARGADEVLSRLIPNSVLRVDDGRLVTPTDRSPTELYCELSDGERAAIAADIAAKVLPSGGVVVLQQSIWEGWTTATRQAVAEKLKSVGVVAITAEAADENLQATVYQ